MQIYFYLTKKY